MNIWEGLKLSTPPRLLLGIILDHLNFEPQLRLTFSQREEDAFRLYTIAKDIHPTKEFMYCP